ncbi:hypothetical protein WG219_20755 [Ectopseudomonas mendocina]|uniref:Pullulanase n=1 Tax=Ectopseudomonas mendocina TaxID=300 RepID=A0ABZ2RF96_ECTME
MKILKMFLITTFVLLLILVISAYLVLERSDEAPPSLEKHPNAYWSGAQDGGVFFEITKASPPEYYIEIRYENGQVWTEGWVQYLSPLTNQDLFGYDGGDVVYLQDGTPLKLKTGGFK